MSKESKIRDMWNHVGTTRPDDFCTGCGYFAFVNGGVHRADCTRGQKAGQ